MSARFTAWFSDVEREAIRRAARNLHCSENFIVRSTVRAGLGLDGNGQLLPLLHVTNDTAVTTPGGNDV